MLKALRHHPLLAGTSEVLVDAVRYVAIVMIVLLLGGQLAKVALRSGRGDQLRLEWTTMTAPMRSSARGGTG